MNYYLNFMRLHFPILGVPWLFYIRYDSKRFLSACFHKILRLRGATVARLTPDQKVACSNHVVVNYLCAINFSQICSISSRFLLNFTNESSVTFI